MARNLSMALVALALALTGCSMCQSPFDYCGPVAGPDGRPNCDFCARHTSAFHPMEGDAETAPEGPTPAAPEAFETESENELPAPAADGYDDAGPIRTPGRSAARPSVMRPRGR